MSDRQKVLFSILGATVGHLLLFLLVGLLLSAASLLSPQAGQAATPPPPAPEEVTILLADLMEQVELVPKDLTQQYLRTDADQESPVKPKDAPFHSDRNTVATSQLPPDRNSDLEAPTVEGRTDLPFLEIRDRQFVDGEFVDPSAVPPPSPPAAPASPAAAMAAATPTLTLNDPSAATPTPVREPSEQRTEETLKSEADPADRPKEAPEARPRMPADAETPPERAAEEETGPVAPVLSDQNVMALRQESVETPFPAEPVAQARPDPVQDREAEARRRTEVAGEPAAPETPLAASALPIARPFLPSPPRPPEETPSPSPSPSASPAPASPALPPGPNPPTDAPAFTPETRARSMQGNVDHIGNTPSFNVEASALGRYKKLVTQAVERQWHRYREKHAEFVTYGTLKVKFRVDREGVPRGLRIVKNEANAVMADFTLRAVLDADIPAMPADVSSMLGSSGLEITYDVIVY